MRNDTIAAVATARGAAGVAVVRVSGPDAFAVADQIAGAHPEPGRFRFSIFRDSSGHKLDEGLVLVFAAPHSYTGENVVEFQGHGGSISPERVLAACFAAGARLARRGEFTERAFLNGKLDYSEAESVLALIEAKTARAADAALAGVDGVRTRTLRDLYERALALSSEIEHSLDVDESDLTEPFFASVADGLAALREAVAAELRCRREGRLLREGALVVLAGPPNAGKSSLMNALLGENRAIVSSVAGTTRDTIEEWLDIGGWPVRLVDTAGIRESADAIESEGVRRAQAAVEKADLVLDLTGERPASSAVIAIHAKCDLGRGEGINVSAKTGEGLDDLRRAIAARLEVQAESAGGASEGDRNVATLERCAATLTAAAVDDLVLLGGAVRKVGEELGELVGSVYSEDLLTRLFSRFCVGK